MAESGLLRDDHTEFLKWRNGALPTWGNSTEGALWVAWKAATRRLEGRITELHAALEAERGQTEFAGRHEADTVWLIECTHATNPRWYWAGGDSFGCDPFKAVRFLNKKAAEETAKKIYGEHLWLCAGTKIEICEHMFNCGSAV